MIARLTSICSALILISAALGQTDREWLERVQNADASDRDAARQLLESMQDAYSESDDIALKQEIDDQLRRARTRRTPDMDAIAARLDLRTKFDREPPTTAGENAREILAEPTFRDSDDAKGDNWISRALQRLRDLLPTPRERTPPEIDVPDVNVKPLAYLLLFALIGGVVVLAAFALRGIRLGRDKRVGQVKRSILDEDEPDRTLDEWLVLADRLQSEGRLREVVRCLYIALLLRMDAARIIRFERSETNWEHLARIESSAAPAGIEYRRLTKKFDLIWYGEHSASIEDCADLRAQYEELNNLLRRPS